MGAAAHAAKVSKARCHHAKSKRPVRLSFQCAPPHTRLTSMKRFTDLKVNLKHLGLYIGAKVHLFSYEFEYFHQCIMTFWVLRDSKGPILMHQVHLIRINDIDPERRFVNLFGKFSPLCAAVATNPGTPTAPWRIFWRAAFWEWNFFGGRKSTTTYLFHTGISAQDVFPSTIFEPLKIFLK